MNRRELLGAVGAMGFGAVLGTARAHADEPGKMAGVPMMGPLGNHHLHFCGIHCAKKDGRIQVLTQHYCGMISGDMHQCLLYDGTSKTARLLGVEYIIPDETYRRLPEVEKRYWHPHTYEVLGGGLIAPAMQPAEELAFMRGLLTTWGKTWHTWPDPTTPVPMGEPLLMWSLTGDGQDAPGLIAKRDKELGVTTAQVRKKRSEAIGYEVPAVPPPSDVDVIGRQWTATGADKPTPRR
jgi:hypothetical protein